MAAYGARTLALYRNEHHIGGRALICRTRVSSSDAISRALPRVKLLGGANEGEPAQTSDKDVFKHASHRLPPLADSRSTAVKRSQKKRQAGGSIFAISSYNVAQLINTNALYSANSFVKNAFATAGMAPAFLSEQGMF